MERKKVRSRFWHDLSVRSVKLLNIILVCIPFAYIWQNFYSKQVYGGEFSLGWSIIILSVYVLIYVLFARIYDAFQINQVRRSELFFSQMIAIVLADAVFFILIFVLLRSLPDLFVFMCCIMIQILILLIWCLTVATLYFKVFKKRKAVVIYDSIHNLYEITKHVMFKRGFELAGTYDIDELKTLSEAERSRWIIDWIKDAEVVFIMEIPSHERNMIIKYCVENRISCYDEPKISDILLRSSKQYYMYNLPMVLVERYYPSPEYMVIKRLNDIILAVLAFVALIPVSIILALTIKFTDKGPVLYRQKRLTKDGREFNMYKFRSMKLDAEKDTGAVLSAGKKDPRVTKIGRFMRRTRLDELPQLINIIKGDMSIVGPRPERPEIFEKYTKDLPEFSLRLQVRAGLTGYAQVYGRYDSDPYDKLCMDLHYIATAGLVEDSKIILATIKRILFREPEGIPEDDNDE